MSDLLLLVRESAVRGAYVRCLLGELLLLA
jgi:hypothetical protein